MENRIVFMRHDSLDDQDEDSVDEDKACI